MPPKKIEIEISNSLRTTVYKFKFNFDENF